MTVYADPNGVVIEQEGKLSQLRLSLDMTPAAFQKFEDLKIIFRLNSGETMFKAFDYASWIFGDTNAGSKLKESPDFAWVDAQNNYNLFEWTEFNTIARKNIHSNWEVVLVSDPNENFTKAKNKNEKNHRINFDFAFEHIDQLDQDYIVTEGGTRAERLAKSLLFLNYSLPFVMEGKKPLAVEGEGKARILHADWLHDLNLANLASLDRPTARLEYGCRP